MRVFAWLLLTLSGWILTAAPVAGQEAAAKFAELRPGMTAEEVSGRLNHRKPEQVLRQVIYRRHVEQWLFNSGAVRLHFDCRPGEEPRLIRVSRE